MLHEEQRGVSPRNRGAFELSRTLCSLTTIGQAVSDRIRKTRGPFAQFQNSADDEDSLTKLVLQLIRRNSDAEPREEAVRRQVSAFRASIERLIALKPNEKSVKPRDAEASDAAKLFEEIKVMFRDLPERLHGQFSERTRRRRKIPPAMFRDLLLEGQNVNEAPYRWAIVPPPNAQFTAISDPMSG
jgi:hypothetical protein